MHYFKTICCPLEKNTYFFNCEFPLITIYYSTTESRSFSTSSFTYQLIVSALQLMCVSIPWVGDFSECCSLSSPAPFKLLHRKAHPAAISQVTGIVRQGECVLCVFWKSCVLKCSATPHTWSKAKEQALVPGGARVGGGACSWAALLTKGIKSSFALFFRTKENGFDREPLHSEHPSKRPCTISPGQRYSPNNGLSYQPNGLPHPTPPPPQHYRLDDMAIAHHYRDSYRHPNHRDLRDRNRPMGKTCWFYALFFQVSFFLVITFCIVNRFGFFVN